MARAAREGFRAAKLLSRGDEHRCNEIARAYSWSSLKVVENGDGFVAFCESTGESRDVRRADVICHQLNSRQLAADLNAVLNLGRKPEWLDKSRRVWFLGNLSLELHRGRSTCRCTLQAT